MRVCAFTVSMLVFLTVMCSPLQAQESQGLRFGAFTLAPKLQLAMRYSDNVYFVPQDFAPTDKDVIPQQKESDFIFNAIAGFNMAVTVPSFDARLGYEFYNDTYLGYDDEGDNHGDLNAMNHTVSGGLGYQTPIGLFMRLQDTFIIQQAFTESEEFVDFLEGEQNHNDGRVYIGYRRGPYSNLYVHGMYMNTLDQYRDYDIYDRMVHRGEADVRFKFLPRTAVVFTGGGGVSGNDNLPDRDVNMYYGAGGLRGQITDHLLLTLKGGYAWYDFASEEDYLNFLAKGEFGAVWGTHTKVLLGYERRVTLATDTNFFSTDEIYLRFKRLWFSRLMTQLWGSYQINSFSTPLAREETFIQGRADITYRILYWLYVGGGYSLENKIQTDPADYTTIRHVGTVKVVIKF